MEQPLICSSKIRGSDFRPQVVTEAAPTPIASTHTRMLKRSAASVKSGTPTASSAAQPCLVDGDDSQAWPQYANASATFLRARQRLAERVLPLRQRTVQMRSDETQIDRSIKTLRATMLERAAAYDVAKCEFDQSEKMRHLIMAVLTHPDPVSQLPLLAQLRMQVTVPSTAAATPDAAATAPVTAQPATSGGSSKRSNLSFELARTGRTQPASSMLHRGMISAISTQGSSAGLSSSSASASAATPTSGEQGALAVPLSSLTSSHLPPVAELDDGASSTTGDHMHALSTHSFDRSSGADLADRESMTLDSVPSALAYSPGRGLYKRSRSQGSLSALAATLQGSGVRWSGSGGVGPGAGSMGSNQHSNAGSAAHSLSQTGDTASAAHSLAPSQHSNAASGTGQLDTASHALMLTSHPFNAHPNTTGSVVVKPGSTSSGIAVEGSASSGMRGLLRELAAGDAEMMELVTSSVLSTARSQQATPVSFLDQPSPRAKEAKAQQANKVRALLEKLSQRYYSDVHLRVWARVSETRSARHAAVQPVEQLLVKRERLHSECVRLEECVRAFIASLRPQMTLNGPAAVMTGPTSSSEHGLPTASGSSTGAQVHAATLAFIGQHCAVPSSVVPAGASGATTVVAPSGKASAVSWASVDLKGDTSAPPVWLSDWWTLVQAAYAEWTELCMARQQRDEGFELIMKDPLLCERALASWQAVTSRITLSSSSSSSSPHTGTLAAKTSALASGKQRLDNGIRAVQVAHT